MAEHGVCPWWVGYILANPIRKLAQDQRHDLQVRPVGQVREKDDFENELALAAEAGLATVDRPLISRSQAAVLKRARRDSDDIFVALRSERR
jgi:hypothetical protein